MRHLDTGCILGSVVEERVPVVDETEGSTVCQGGAGAVAGDVGRASAGAAQSISHEETAALLVWRLQGDL